MAIITFTEAAKQHIRALLKPGAAFRLATKVTGCSGYAYVPELVQQPKEGDIAQSIEEFPVFVDKASEALLQGTVVDYVSKGLGQQQLVFNNPNASGNCGCGESFSVRKDD